MIVHAGQRKTTPKGRPGLWDEGRHLLWSWWLWALIAVVSATTDHPKSAIITAIVAIFTYITTPHEHSPQYGLESSFSISSPEFIDSIIGTTGVAFLSGSGVKVLNNGDEFYPEMLRTIQGATRSVTIEAYIYWKGAVGRGLTYRTQRLMKNSR